MSDPLKSNDFIQYDSLNHGMILIPGNEKNNKYGLWKNKKLQKNSLKVATRFNFGVLFGHTKKREINALFFRFFYSNSIFYSFCK